jgi:predicted nucleotidyltransferase
MRLLADQIQSIQAVIRQIAGNQAKTWLYGSRLDDARRGGDVDLIVQTTPPINLIQRARIKTQLESQLGLPVDVLACGDDSALSPFARIAITQGVLL